MRGQDIEGEIMISLREAAQGGDPSGGLDKSGSTQRKRVVQKFNVRIPPGIREGQRIRVARQGHAGHGSGEAGDLFLRARLASDPDFRVKRGDLYYDLELDPWDGSSGNSGSRPHPGWRGQTEDPRKHCVRTAIRIAGKGLPSTKGATGDLFVEIQIKTPPVTTDAQRKAWEELRGSYN